MTTSRRHQQINYSNWSKSDLIREIKKLGKRKKYGLIWDEERVKEVFEEETQRKLPILKEVMENGIKDASKPNNILIEGDNYHALAVLNYTHQGKIDVIYIDPPYNTGNRSWKYNNNYIEKDDAFKHSKWISFIHKRLQLAKKILKQSGIIIVTIDDYEIHTLRLLMDEIFDENNRLGTIVVVHNPRGRNDDKYFATMHEYMLVYSKNSDFASVGHFDLSEEDIDAFNMKDDISQYALTSFMRTGNNSDRRTRPNLFYPIYFIPSKNQLSLKNSTNSIELLPINSSNEEKTWRWGEKTFLEKKDTELVVKKIKNNYRVFKKRRLTTLKGKKPRTVWYEPRYDASSHGIMVLQNIFKQKNMFPYPKSIWSVFDILQLVTTKNSLVVDFFAGSGTTGHAILKLNKNDGGNRKFILCTNNEADICTDVCYPRLKKVIKGYENLKHEKVEGLGGNLKYFKTAFVDSEPTDQNKKIMVEQSTEMLCLKEDCFEPVTEGDQFRILKNQNGCYLGIIYYYDGIESYKKEVKRLGKKINTYVFSLTDEIDEEEFKDIQSAVTLKPIPSAILNVYRKIFGYVQTTRLPRKACK